MDIIEQKYTEGNVEEAREMLEGKYGHMTEESLFQIGFGISKDSFNAEVDTLISENDLEICDECKQGFIEAILATRLAESNVANIMAVLYWYDQYSYLKL